MPMNPVLLNALNQIVSQYGGVETLSNPKRVKALLADLAANEPRPQKNALIACIEQGFVEPLQKMASVAERGRVKAKMAERLNREEGLDLKLCTDMLDLLETALFGNVSQRPASKTAITKKAPSSAGRYYPSINYQQSGPFTLEQLKSMAGSGRILKNYLVRKGDKSDWISVTKLPELKSLFVDTGKGNKPAPSKVKPQLTASERQDGETWRELRTLTGYTDVVKSVAYSPDGCRIVSGYKDKTIKIWDMNTGREPRTLLGHSNTGWLTVWSVAYSPDGSRIVSGYGDTTIDIWNAKTGRELLTLTGHTGEVHSTAYSPDGSRIISGSFDKTIKIWDAESGRELLTLEGHTDRVTSVAYSPNGNRIVSGAEDKTVRIWDAWSGRELLILTGHTNEVHSVAYSPDGSRIASGSEDSTVRIWDAQSGRELLTLTGHTNTVWSVAYSPDGRRIVSGSMDNTIKIWDAESGRKLRTLKGHTAGVKSVAYSPNGRRIVSGSWDKTIKIWGRE